MLKSSRASLSQTSKTQKRNQNRIGKLITQTDMKRLLTLLALVLCSCAETFVGEEIAKPNSENLPDLTATFAEEDATRTYIEDGKYLRWNEDDRLTAFYGNTLNRQYKFNGQTGDNSGTFSLVADGMLDTGNAFDHIYALYPYNADARITDEGVITLTLPETQSYAENSFGLGANTMVAVTENLEDTFLAFKNVGGYLKLKLYNAEGATLKSIEVKGNNGEKLAGEATLSINFGEAPTLTMAESATDAITLHCGEGVALGTTAETATEFWIVLPATTFAEGLTITATDTEGGVFEKSTTKEVIIERNAIQPMATLEAKFIATKPANNEIWYTATSKITPNYIGATIKSHTFDGATGHGVITFNTNITNISANAFANCYDLTGITLPESITSIGDYAFDVCYWLTNMTIPNSVTKIGRGVFQNCLRLENITLSNNITSIQEGTFAYCEALTSVTIPASVTTIDKAAFTGCYALAAFDSKFASEDKRCVVIDGTLCAFAPAELTSYTLPNNVTSIAVVLYSEILESITIPESVTSIGFAAFYNCYNLTVVYCNVVTPPTLATYTFPEKTTTIYVPAQSVTAYKSASGWSTYESRIRGYDFEKGEVVPEVLKPANNEIWYTNGSTTSPNKPKSESKAFDVSIVSNSYDAEKECWVMTFNGDVTYIGSNAFYNGNYVISILMPDSVTEIGSSAFSNQSNLKRITISENATSIGMNAFWACKNLTEIIIPEAVTSIGSSAFGSCQKLAKIYCKPTVPPIIDLQCFSNNAADRKIYVPMESVEAYKSTSGWSDYADAIVGYEF